MSRKGQELRRWTDADDDAVRSIQSEADVGPTADRIGRTRAAVVQRRHTLHLPSLRAPRRAWTPEEDAALDDYSRSMIEIAEDIGRTPQACALRRMRLGLPLRPQGSGLPPETVRREGSIRRRSTRLAAGLCMRCGRVPPVPGLVACRSCTDASSDKTRAWKRQHPEAGTEYARQRRAADPHTGRPKRCWSSDEDALLLDYSLTLREIGEQLGRSEASCALRAKRLGIKRALTAGRDVTTRAAHGPASE